ncbi:uncharacterized protein LOC121827239 [Peromyscus maniculatus bairdii]|uniref:uncharacterized protein LOC121827239 n=1 Tax=Peromyscus maniculatus bairdii TaxID=230844 RepID=UPI003FD118E1
MAFLLPEQDRVDLELTMKTKLTLNLWNSSSLSFPRAEITAVEASHLAFGHSVDQNVHSERLASIKFPRLQMEKLRFTISNLDCLYADSFANSYCLPKAFKYLTSRDASSITRSSYS